MYERYAHTIDEQLQQQVDQQVDRQRQAWIAEPPLTAKGEPKSQEWQDKRLEKLGTKLFKKAKRYQNKSLYAFVEIPLSLLEEEVDKKLPWSTISTGEMDGDEPVMRPKLLKEYVIVQLPSLVRGNTIILLAGMQAPTYRLKGVKAKELRKWHDWLAPLGYGNTNWMNRSELVVGDTDA